MNTKYIRFKTFIVCLVSAIGLAACGGDSDGVVNSGSQVNVQPPPSDNPNVRYGAIVSYDLNGSRDMYVFENSGDFYGTDARSRAISQCNEDIARLPGASSCRVHTTFTNCVSVASSFDFGIYGFATGNDRSSARSSAIAQCNLRGGRNCRNQIRNEACVTPFTQQTSQFGGLRNSMPQPTLTFTVTDECHDSQNVDYAFFYENRTPLYGSLTYNTGSFFKENSHTIRCTLDTGRIIRSRICFGGSTDRLRWGFGRDGTHVSRGSTNSDWCAGCPTSGNRPFPMPLRCP